MCYAHAKGARVVLKGDVPVKNMLEPAARELWITQQVELAKKQYMDGINIDIEQAVSRSSPEYDALTDLVKETTDAFHSAIPGSQVTFDVAWSPECIDQRCYNYIGLANACDFVFVMSYDEQSQTWGECIARPNAPYNKTVSGYEDYINMGIDPKKLVMGVPWYGYDYTCLNLSEDHICSIKPVPFHGAPCSDAAGRQVPYRIIMDQVTSSISGSQWDAEQEAPYYEYKGYLQWGQDCCAYKIAAKVATGQFDDRPAMQMKLEWPIISSRLKRAERWVYELVPGLAYLFGFFQKEEHDPLQEASLVMAPSSPRTCDVVLKLPDVNILLGFCCCCWFFKHFLFVSYGPSLTFERRDFNLVGEGSDLLEVK
ncbi:di-N-acetylchitobiase-like isoform X1 [Alligator sinensis]|uniref:Di-N-acetylchitobiase-like isoform X1 n=1 Tax=Alligator sinensis TaxID=38654 RepID=A0A3Q0HIQ0_ALLSI|nr:di-N-acetylchitobiase-like isoform X1 [Alligator sinensis]